MNIVFGLIGITASFLMVKYRRQVMAFTGSGPFSFLDRWLGAGHASFTYILVCLFIFFFSIAYMIGAFDSTFNTQVTELVVPGEKTIDKN